MTRATSDLNAIRMVLSTAVIYTADAIVFFGLALVIMLRIDTSLTVVGTASVPNPCSLDSLSRKTVACPL